MGLGGGGGRQIYMDHLLICLVSSVDLGVDFRRKQMYSFDIDYECTRIIKTTITMIVIIIPLMMVMIMITVMMTTTMTMMMLTTTTMMMISLYVIFL